MSYQEQLTRGQVEDTPPDERLATHDLLQTASADPQFSRFVTAISACGLESLLRGPDLLTVFVPVNDAFEQFGETSEQGVDLSKKADVFRYHMTPGALTAVELGTAETLNTLQGVAVRLSSEDGEVRVGGARILRPDVECTNGVLHGIDRILNY
jgi:uncharacterized surface protein with fasciclin (FAS1) repeats